MGALRRLAVGAAACCATVAAVPSIAGATPPLDWPEFRACPVDTAAMLAVPAGGLGSGCADLQGFDELKLGKAQVFNDLAFFFGVAGAEPGEPTLGAVVPPTTGNPMPIAGGGDYSVLGEEQTINNLANLCNVFFTPFPNPNGGPLYNLCFTAVEELAFGPAPVTAITVTPQLAGMPSDFGPSAILSTGYVLTLPLKFHLQNVLFGNTCYVGSNQHPVVLHINQVKAPILKQAQDPNGFPVTLSGTGNGVLTAEPFAVPGATGCGPDGLLDGVVNALFGLPAPAGRSTWTMTIQSGALAWTTAGGSVLSQAYHAALG